MGKHLERRDPNVFRPPWVGGFDRWIALFAGIESIRDVIVFPKNNSGHDEMIDTRSPTSREQPDELSLKVDLKE